MCDGTLGLIIVPKSIFNKYRNYCFKIFIYFIPEQKAAIDYQSNTITHFERFNI